MELQGREGLVARGQEAGQGQLRHHRLSHGQRLGGRAYGGVGPGDRHQPQFAVELRRRQLDHRLAVHAGLDHAGPQGDGLDRRHRQALAADAVRPEVHICRGAQVWIEQAAIVVAVVERQGPLAEIPLHGIGALELGQLQDAFIHRRQGHPRAAAEAGALDGDRDLQHGLGIDLGWGVQLHRQLSVLGIERHIDEAERPARLGRGDRIARLHHADQDIGPAAPGGVGLQAHGRAVLADGDGLEVNQSVGRDSDLRLAGIGRLQGDLDGVALGVGLGSGADTHEVGGLDVLGGRTPAGGEADDALGAARSG